MAGKGVPPTLLPILLHLVSFPLKRNRALLYFLELRFPLGRVADTLPLIIQIRPLLRASISSTRRLLLADSCEYVTLSSPARPLFLEDSRGAATAQSRCW